MLRRRQFEDHAAAPASASERIRASINSRSIQVARRVQCQIARREQAIREVELVDHVKPGDRGQLVYQSAGLQRAVPHTSVGIPLGVEDQAGRRNIGCLVEIVNNPKVRG